MVDPEETLASSNPNIIVVDDDPEIRDVVTEYLSEEGFSVFAAQDGTAMRALVEKKTPDLVLLDLKLPGEDGLALARKLRQTNPDTGIIMISGKEEVVDRVTGLEVGADDYIIKPFHLRELLARIRSVLRRSNNSLGSQIQSPTSQNGGSTPGTSSERKVYRFSDWVLDNDERTLASTNGNSIELTSGEFDLLIALVSRPNRALSREQLLDYSRNREANSFDRSIDVQIGRLRRKIERDPKRPALIKTVRNIGYKFSADVTLSNG